MSVILKRTGLFILILSIIGFILLLIDSKIYESIVMVISGIVILLACSTFSEIIKLLDSINKKIKK